MSTTRRRPVRPRSCRPATPLVFDHLEPRVLLSGRRTSDDFPNTYSNAFPIELAPDGSGGQAGVIERKRDIDVFQFIAPISGRMTVIHSARPGSRLDSALFLSDSNWNYIPNQFVMSGQKAIDVTAGATYYAGAFGFGNRLGAYQITFRTAAADGAPPGGTTTLTVTGTPGDDVITWGAGGQGLRHLVINGTARDLEAEYGADVLANFTRIHIRLLDGDDRLTIDSSIGLPAVIDGDGGNDVIAAGSGNDTVRGGAGADFIISGAGNDVLDGGSDSDSASGLAGGNTLLGGDGSDSLLGGVRDDLLDGGAGNDTLSGGAGNDFLDGGPGNNTLSGSIGSDTWAMLGSDGSDTIVVQSALGTASRTTLGAALQQDRFTDLSSLDDRFFADGGAGHDSIAINGILRGELWGGDGNDSLQGGSNSDSLDGGSGDDRLLGMAGNDLLFGYGGNDVVDGADGADTLVGSGGLDVMRPGAGANQVQLAGLTESGSTLATTFARGASGVLVSFTRTVTIPGSVQGFSGSATATVTVSGSLGSDGVLSGTLTASGSASGSGSGCTARGTFSAAGSVRGPLSAVAWNVNYSGSGTVTCRAGQFSGGLSGSYAGVVSLASGAGSQSMTADSGGGMSGSSSLQVPEFTSSSSRHDAIGSANACPVQSATAQRDARSNPCTRREPQFETGPWKPGEQERIQNLIPLIQDPNQRQWILNNVRFERGGAGPRISVRPGTLQINDGFFALDADYNESDQANILVFELGKAYWFGVINAGSSAQPTNRESQFANMYFRNSEALDAMRHAQFNGRDLSFSRQGLADRLDHQSMFAHIYRVVVMKLDPPETAPPGYGADEWDRIKSRWRALRDPVLKPYFDRLQNR